MKGGGVLSSNSQSFVTSGDQGEDFEEHSLSFPLLYIYIFFLLFFSVIVVKNYNNNNNNNNNNMATG